MSWYEYILKLLLMIRYHNNDFDDIEVMLSENNRFICSSYIQIIERKYIIEHKYIINIKMTNHLIQHNHP